MIRIKNNFPISPPQGGRNSQRLMVSSEGDFYKMHLIIVYNLFGETKHLLRSWILSSSHHQPRGRREIYLTSYPTWLILSLCALRCTSVQHCVIYFESAQKVSETRAGAFSSHSLRLRPKHDWLNHSMNCTRARKEVNICMIKQHYCGAAFNFCTLSIAQRSFFHSHMRATYN